MNQTTPSPAEALTALDAARAAELDVLADTRPNPGWLWPTIGGAAFLFFASFDVVGGSPWVVLSSILYALAIGVIIGILQRQRGSQARLSRLPAELRNQVLVFAIAGGVVTSAGTGVALLLMDGPPRFTIVGTLIGALTVLGGKYADGRWIEAAERIRSAGRS